MDHKDVTKGGASVPALRRAVAILDHLSETSEELTAADLCRALKIPKSTAHGLLQAMEELGLVIRDPAGRLGIGPRPMRWSSRFLAKSDLVSAFRQHFDRDARLSGYTITLTVLEETEVVYVACSNSSQPLGVTFRIGMRLPAAFTATGKAQLAALPEAEVAARFAGGFPAPLTRYSVRDLAALRAGLDRDRARGFSVDDGETREGMTCLGAPVRNHEGRVVAGLALSLTRSEATAEKVEELGAQLRSAADGISALIGG
ncbi:IclR family transcriptional regulator [Poseidonocella sp. HB161398]|uniref:IclR family transcriptional regulator n=1 Tax=Poseidonocella sp. HB161398 TaxID=2320855 RepID=UPI00110804AC|nr:IclR family transcriptional regulator [Poseidonocella sp. HB161398]